MLKKRAQKRNSGYGKRNKALSYCSASAYRPGFARKKRKKKSFLLRQLLFYIDFVKEFKWLKGEFGIYKNRIRDCEYEVYKIVKVLDKHGWIDSKFRKDALE